MPGARRAFCGRACGAKLGRLGSGVLADASAVIGAMQPRSLEAAGGAEREASGRRDGLVCLPIIRSAAHLSAVCICRLADDLVACSCEPWKIGDEAGFNRVRNLCSCDCVVFYLL